MLPGVISVILDNAPLRTIAIQMLNTNVADLWVLLTLSVCTGGSLFVAGSAAVVVAMGMNRDLSFKHLSGAFRIYGHHCRLVFTVFDNSLR